MIKVKNLNKIFNQDSNKEFQALKNINFELSNGTCTILKGISGSGKSTLLSILGTLLKPTNGEVLVENENISKLPDLHSANFRAKKIGFIFQSYNLFETLSVKENIAIPLIPLGYSQKQIDEKIKKALALSNIEHKSTQIIHNLSGGEKQRCAIARAIVNKPNIILCDEPTANLDYNNSLNFLETIEELKKENRTIIVASHDPIFDGLDFVDKVLNIEDGKLYE